MISLTRDFFEQQSLIVAQNLLGKILVFDQFIGIITETESYHGFDDNASHGFKGQTKRNFAMFGPAGISYVYFIYGMYYCLNIVTELPDYPAAVLIRGLYLLKPHILNLNGPGKLCRALGINLTHNNCDLINNPNFYIADVNLNPKFIATPRIGISKSQELEWRFIIEDISSLKNYILKL